MLDKPEYSNKQANNFGKNPYCLCHTISSFLLFSAFCQRFFTLSDKIKPKGVMPSDTYI